VYFIIFRFFSNPVRVHEFDDFGFVNIIMSVAMAVISYLVYIGLMPSPAFSETIANLLSFYIAVFLIGKLLGVQKSMAGNANTFKKVFSQADGLELYCSLLIVIFTISTVFFSYIQLRFGISPEDRIVFAKQFRIIDILRGGSLGIILPLSLLLYIIFKNRLSLLSIITCTVLSATLGSKSFFLTVVISYFTVTGLYRGGIRFYSDIKSIVILFCIIFSSVFFVLFYYSENADQALLKFIQRIVYAGDVFIYAYNLTDYHKLIDLYNPVTYFLHPFLRLVGLQGYDLPIGSELAASAFGVRDGTGPNANFSVVALVLMQGNVLASATLCFCAGALVALMKYLSSRMLLADRIPPIWRISGSLVLFPSAWLLIDVGEWEQKMVTAILVFGLISIIFEVLGGKYFRSPPVIRKT